MLNKKILIIIFSSLIFILLLSVLIVSLLDNRIIINNNKNYLYADKLSTAFYKINYANKLKEFLMPFNKKYEIKGIENLDKVKVIKSNNGFYIQGGFEPCSLEFTINIDKKSITEKLNLINDMEDFNKDGFPDVAELITENDRRSFIEWFAVIAESQYYKESVKWEEIHHDCAGLINFCYKEALKKHDNQWYKNFPYLTNKDIPDVSRFNYPDIPLLKDNVFRTKSGDFKIEDLSNNIFKPVADANNLVNFNLAFITKSISSIQKGDILCFNVVENVPEAFHTMIYVGDPDFLIYHTGQIDDNNKGEVRKVSIKDLFNHPDKNWHPEESNPCFMGIYRWRILI